MSVTGQNLINQINTVVRNYAAEAFHNMQLNSILLQLVQWIDSGGTTGPVTGPSVLALTSANFTNATDCPLVALNGVNIQVSSKEFGGWLVKGTDWIDLVGGGFRIIMSGFDSTTDNFHFYVFTS